MPTDYSHEVQLSRSRSVRRIYWIVGTVLAGLGIAGIVLPVLPGMPFLILATWCYARASTRFYNWLLNHRLVGPPLHQWRSHRRMPRSVKPRAAVAVVLAFATTAIFVIEPLVLRLAWIALGLGVLWILWRVPTFDDRRVEESRRREGPEAEEAA
jgi:uncharacterized membrane protein YbaN (DUF454 family)